MRVWREEKLRALRGNRIARVAGSIEVEVDKFLRRETGRRHQDFAILLGHWSKRFAGKSLVLLSPAEIQQALDEWRAQGVKASTVNHRRGALRSLFRRLDPDSPNPVDRTRPFKEPEPEPRAVPEDVLERVFAAMPESVTKARLEIIAHTGMRHSELMRVRPDDLTLLEGAPAVMVRSGKGGRPRLVPLNGRALSAFQRLGAANGWGVFSQSSARIVWHRACRAAGVPLLYRPYDLRHRFATRLREKGADLADVQELLGHKDIRTTRRYAPVVRAKLVNLVNALEATDATDPAGLAPRREADHHGPEGAHPALPAGPGEVRDAGSTDAGVGPGGAADHAAPGRGQALTLAGLLVVDRNWQSRPQ